MFTEESSSQAIYLEDIHYTDLVNFNYYPNVQSLCLSYVCTALSKYDLFGQCY